MPKCSIRALKTADLRFRRISGRTQISADGKHLIDGVAFGRPFLRRADRPAIRIPPRKRARLTYDEEDDSEVDIIPNRITFRPSGEGYEDGEESSEEEEEYNGINDDELQEEIRYLTNDVQDHEIDMAQARQTMSNRSQRDTRRTTRSRSRNLKTGLGIEGSGMSVLLPNDETRFLGPYQNPLLDNYYDDEPRHQDSAWSKKKSHNAVARDSRRSSRSSTKSVRFEGAELETPATIRMVEDTEDSEDEDFNPNGIASSNSSESNKENVEPMQTLVIL